MPVDRASTSASSFGMAQVPSFPRNRESRVFDLVSSLSRGVSPLASSFSCFAKKRNQKKATPTVPVALRATTLRCSSERAAAELAHATWRLRSLRHPRRTTPVPPALLGGTNGASPQAPSGVPFLLVDPPSNVWGRDLFGAPVGPAEKHRALRGSRRALTEHPQSPDCGCELRSRLRGRASQGSRVATGTVGACFLWVLSLHEQRKYLADRRNLAVQQT
jgi:hypothetical protein